MSTSQYQSSAKYCYCYGKYPSIRFSVMLAGRNGRYVYQPTPTCSPGKMQSTKGQLLEIYIKYLVLVVNVSVKLISMFIPRRYEKKMEIIDFATG